MEGHAVECPDEIAAALNGRPKYVASRYGEAEIGKETVTFDSARA